MTSSVDRLQAWYLSQCDSLWEQANSIQISSLDNPGWQVRIDLDGTRWCGRPFEVKQHDRAEHDWLRCWVAGSQWQAATGPCNLDEAIGIFLAWVGADDSPAPRGDAVDDWLRQRWAERQQLNSRDEQSEAEGRDA